MILLGRPRHIDRHNVLTIFHFRQRADRIRHLYSTVRRPMADLKALLSDLRRAEARSEKQLAGIRAALASLEIEILATPFRRRGRMSTEVRAKISVAQK